MMLVYNN